MVTVTQSTPTIRFLVGNRASELEVHADSPVYFDFKAKQFRKRSFQSSLDEVWIYLVQAPFSLKLLTYLHKLRVTALNTW